MRLLKNDNIYEIIDTSKEMNVKFYTSIDKGSYVPNHWHRAIEMIYLLEGELTVNVDGKSSLLKAGQCVLININEIHSTRCNSKNKAILLQIPIEFIKNYLPNVEQYIFFIKESKQNIDKINMLKNILLEMEKLNNERKEDFKLEFNILLLNLISLLNKEFKMTLFVDDIKFRNKNLERLDLVLAYIAKNYKKTISLEEISKIAILQPKSFCRFFKKYMGITFLEYQNELRLSYIYHDLIESDLHLYEILERHGFSNYKLFRKLFKKHFMYTPMNIRKQMKNN